jgi:GTPase involved in cell partitioning and DNA repair
MKLLEMKIDKYSNKLANKKEIIVASKMDLENAKDNLKSF